MKIIAIDSTTKKPLINTRVQLQVKGKDSGFLTVSTNDKGELQLDDKYNGQQICSLQGPTVNATEGATLTIAAGQTAGARETAGATTGGKQTTGTTSGGNKGWK